jgi:hypothetical protein
MGIDDGAAANLPLASTPAWRYHGTKSARVAPASLLFHATKYRILFGRAPDGRVQNSRGFGLYACGNAPRHVIHLTSPAMYGGARRHKRVTRRGDSSRRRRGDVKLCRGWGASCTAGILIRVSTVNLKPRHGGHLLPPISTIPSVSRGALNRNGGIFGSRATKPGHPPEHILLDMFKESRNLQQVPRWKLKTVNGKIPPVGWHFYALLNSDVKFASVPSVERAHRVKRGEVERNTTSIRQIAKIASEHAIHANTKVSHRPTSPPLPPPRLPPGGNRLFIKRKRRGQFENSRKVCRGELRGSSRGNGRIRPIIQAAPFNLCANPLTFSGAAARV